MECVIPITSRYLFGPVKIQKIPPIQGPILTQLLYVII